MQPDKDQRQKEKQPHKENAMSQFRNVSKTLSI